MHDAYRVDKGGKPTFHRVMKGLDVLKRHGVDWNVPTTIHAVNGDDGREVYTFLRDDLGAKFIQFIPIVERATEQTLPIADAGSGHGVHGRPLYIQDGSLVTHRSVGPLQYGRFLIDVFEEWVRRDIGTVYVQMFDTALANFHGERGGMCVHAETCGSQLALEHNGDLYSCDHYVEPLPARQHRRPAHARAGRAAPAGQGRPGQARHPHLVLPRLRRADRVQRRLPERSVRHLLVWRARPALPVPEL